VDQAGEVDEVGERDEQGEPSGWRWFLWREQGHSMRLATNAVVVFGGLFLLNFADGTDDPGEPEKLAYFWVPALLGLVGMLVGFVRHRRRMTRARR
jgi:hypothetical protein